MLISLLCAAVALALLFPETRIGGLLRRVLIEAPARKLDNLKRGHVILAAVVVAILFAAYAFAKQDGLMVAGQMTSEGLGVAMAVDLASWIDIMAVALIVAATVRSREALRLAAVKARQWASRSAGLLAAPFTALARSRARRARPTRRPLRGDDKDRPAPGFAWA